jgi:hypothetical protein
MSNLPRAYVPDEALDYRTNAIRSVPHAGLRLDETYRTLHLPLVNRGHPDVIPVGAGAEMGRFAYPKRSIVAFIAARHITASAGLQEFLDALRALPVAEKISWDSFRAREGRLHSTIAPLPKSYDVSSVATHLASQWPFRFKVLGPWMGTKVNNGRIYLPLYPEQLPEGNSIQAIQQKLQLSLSKFYGIGFLNLKDHLGRDEAEELTALIGRFAKKMMFEGEIDRLAVIETFDSLMLEGSVAVEAVLRGSR